jgi:hypothetical protein
MVGLTSVCLEIDLQPIAVRRSKPEETLGSTDLDACIDMAPRDVIPLVLAHSVLENAWRSRRRRREL